MSPRTVQTDPTTQTGQPDRLVADPPAVPLHTAPGGLSAPAAELPRVVDHVRTHGRACWWDFVECRWVCEKG